MALPDLLLRKGFDKEKKKPEEKPCEDCPETKTEKDHHPKKLEGQHPKVSQPS